MLVESEKTEKVQGANLKYKVIALLSTCINHAGRAIPKQFPWAHVYLFVRNSLDEELGYITNN